MKFFGIFFTNKAQCMSLTPAKIFKFAFLLFKFLKLKFKKYNCQKA